MYQFIRDWKLPISMAFGIIGYFAFSALPLNPAVKGVTFVAVTHVVQPMLIFLMLFLSFCRIRPRQLRLHRWHFTLLLCQAGCFVACTALGMLCDSTWIHSLVSPQTSYSLKLLAEGALLAFICPTATASPVITDKLGGSMAGVVTYLIFCNLMVAVMAPALLSAVEPQGGFNFMTSFFLIMGKVLPLLICPLIAAWLVMFLMPRLLRWLLQWPDLSFHLWMIALPLAIAVTVRSVVHSQVSVWYMVGLAAISCVACLAQFAIGKHVGRLYDQKADDGASKDGSIRITAGQAMGQKNTVLIIWMGLVFLDPITSVVGGFYSIWHNVVNSVQLYRKSHYLVK